MFHEELGFQKIVRAVMFTGSCAALQQPWLQVVLLKLEDKDRLSIAQTGCLDRKSQLWSARVRSGQARLAYPCIAL